MNLELHFWLRLLGILALEISLVIALAFLVQTFIRSAFWRRAIWQITFVCLLFVAVGELTGVGRGLSVWLAGKSVPERNVSVRLIPTDEQFTRPTIEMEMPEPVFIPQEEVPVTRSLWWPGILWLAGFGLIAARILGARIFLTFLRWRKPNITDQTLLNRVTELSQRLCLRRKIHLLETASLSSPMTFGIVWPSIGLPSGFAQKFSPAQQNAMLAHELAHLAARDPFWYLLADCVAALFWWQPLVWWARRRLHSTSEHAADEAAALVENGPGTLAECLVQLGRQMTCARSFGWLGVDGSGFRSHLGQRIERLLNLKEAHQPLRGWKIFFVKTCLTTFCAILVIFTSGWVQNKNAPRSANWKTALEQSWNSSFASLAMIALAENKTEPAPQSDSIESAETPLLLPVVFDTVFYDDVSEGHFERISRTAVGVEDDQDVVILSSNELRQVLLPLSELPSTYDFMGDKFSGIPCFYRGVPNGGNGCEYFTENRNGTIQVTRAEMTYNTANRWNFSFVPQKLADSVWINLEWPNEEGKLATGFEIPNDGGAIVRRAIPGDPARNQLILFSSTRVFQRTTNDAEIEWSDVPAAAGLINEATRFFENGNLNEAKTKLNEALRLDPPNKPALYYLALIGEAEKRHQNQQNDSGIKRPTIPPQAMEKAPQNETAVLPKNLIEETRSKSSSQSREQAAKDALAAVQKSPELTASLKTNLVYTSPGRKRIKEALERIRLPSVEFQAMPLANVLKFLREESKRADEKHKGINFMFNPYPQILANAPANAGASSNSFNDIVVNLTPALHDTRLVDILDSIVGASRPPLQYVIEDYAVVFSPKASEAEPLYTKVFKVNPNTFLQGIMDVEEGRYGEQEQENNFSFPRPSIPQTGGGGGIGLGNVTRTNHQSVINKRLREFFTAAGVDFGLNSQTTANGKAVFFNTRSRLLMVRATLRDLEIIQAAIVELNNETPLPKKVESSSPTKKTRSETPSAEAPLQTRTYNLNVKTFLYNLENALAGLETPPTNSSRTLPADNTTNLQSEINLKVRKFLRAAGVDFEAEPADGKNSLPENRKAVVFDNRSGVFVLLVRASEKDFEIIEMAIHTLNYDPPQVTVEARFVEVADATAEAIDWNELVKTTQAPLSTNDAGFVQFDGFTNFSKAFPDLTLSNSIPRSFATILTEPQRRKLLRQLEQKAGANILSAPKVTTTSGRQAQVSVVNLTPIAAESNGGVLFSIREATNVVVNAPKVETGPTLNVIPMVLSDGVSIQIFAALTVKEIVPQERGGLRKKTSLPKIRQMSATANIYDGQSLVLGELRNEKDVGNKRRLFVFVTATIIDPAGNRVYSEDKMPFATNSVPKQPTQR